MSLKSIKIKNFRQFTRLNLEGPADVTLIGGKNGAGKTSILEGVYLTATGVEASKFQLLELRRRQRGHQQSYGSTMPRSNQSIDLWQQIPSTKRAHSGNQ